MSHPPALSSMDESSIHLGPVTVASRCHFLSEGVAFKVCLGDVASRLMLSFFWRPVGGWRCGLAAWSRSCLVQGCGLATMTYGNPPFFMDWPALEVGRMPETRWRILFGSFVGEGSKLPCVGCLKAWQRWRTAVFLLLCWCCGYRHRWVSFGHVLPIWGSRGCPFFVSSSTTITLDVLYVGIVVVLVACAPGIGFRPIFLKLG